SLVAYYPFNGNANDESGNGNDGTVNGATLTADRFGNANSAYSFTGDNDYITAGNTSNAPTGDFTLLSWIKTDDIEGLIIRKRPLSGTGFSLTIGTGAVGSNGKANIELQDDAGHVQIIETINNVNDNQWHLVASTRQDTIIKLYLDGSEVTTSLYYSTGAISGSLLNDADLNFGQTQNGTNDFDGLIDDIRIYNRALTAYEIDSLYHLNSWGTGLVAYYPFNGNANDESGNGNDGTVNGASLTNDRFGNANSAYSFDGVDDYITIADSPELNTSTITISSWMKLDDIANNGRIISKDNGSSLRSWFLASYGDYGWFHWGVFSGSNHIAVHSQTSRVPNQWHHLVSIYDGNNSKIYLNGALEDEIELLSGINNTGGEEIYIGRYALNSNYIQGVLDDIKIYNRALSATEIDSLYHLNGWAQENISLSIPELSVSMSDTILIPLNVQFMDSTSYSSAEITLSGYQSGLDFLAVVTDSSLTGDAGWTYAVNETDSLLITWAAGSQDISGSGVFCWLQFLVTGNGCTFVPINIESAIFNTGTDSVGITNGGVNIEPTPTYGDVDGNSYIQAYDASLILKHLVGLDTLDCQGLANAEVSANDTLTALDASLILQYGVGLIDTLPYDSVLLAMGTVNMEDGMLVPGAPLDVEIRLTDGANIYSFEG
ncbi:MAG: LamG-like jellyroll fold domain-containing protein, partial [Fidelibacterota bacterium]